MELTSIIFPIMFIFVSIGIIFAALIIIMINSPAKTSKSKAEPICNSAIEMLEKFAQSHKEQFLKYEVAYYKSLQENDVTAQKQALEEFSHFINIEVPKSIEDAKEQAKQFLNKLS